MASRNYSSTTVKVLFTFSGDQCAHPDCDEPIIAGEKENSDAAVIGQIAHIYAYSEDGPRANPDFPKDKINSYKNLLLLCPTHHRIVDSQPETYTAEMLLKWKAAHESKIRSRLRTSISDLGYAQLEVTAQALMPDLVAMPDDNTNILAPQIQMKMEKNNLGWETESLLKMGDLKSEEVKEFLTESARLNPEIPERLKGGFTLQYNKLRGQGVTGDELFLEIWMWASGDSNEESRKLAGLCILTHLFIICDVFEK